MILIKRRLVVLIAILLLLLSACGNSSDSDSKQTQSPVDPLAAATDEFNSAVRNLSDAQAMLSEDISTAETLVKHTTAKEVANAAVLENLRIVLEKAKEYAAITAPEMKSEAEEIQVQARTIAQQADDIYSLYYDIDSAISSVQTSKQDLIEAKRIENLTSSETCVGTVSTETGYEAEYTISMMNWIKASDTETLQLAWERVSTDSGAMPTISQFHSWDNDGFTEANAAIAFGTISFRNITQGFDITQESPVSFGVTLTTSLDTYGRSGSKIYIGTTTPQILGFNASPYPGIAPIMKSNTWGPVVLMIVRPNVFTPNDPDGAELDDFELYINEYGVERKNIHIGTSW